MKVGDLVRNSCDSGYPPQETGIITKYVEWKDGETRDHPYVLFEVLWDSGIIKKCSENQLEVANEGR